MSVNPLTSKTVRLALVFAGVGVGLILFDTLMGYFTGYQVRYVIEFFGLLGTMFTGIAAKNGVDNYFQYQERKTTLITGANIENAPPKPQG